MTHTGQSPDWTAWHLDQDQAKAFGLSLGQTVGSLELELQKALSSLTWAPGTKL